MDYEAPAGGLITKYFKHIGLSAVLVLSAISIVPYVWMYMKKMWVRQMRFFEVASTLPGPPALPLLGNALIMTKNPYDALNTLTKMMKSYMPRLRFWMGPQLYIFTMDPEDTKIILSSQGTTLKADFYHEWKPLVGDSIILTEDPSCKLRRKQILTAMNSETLTSFADIYNHHSEKCASELEGKLDSGEFDLMPFMVRCSNNIVRETVLSTPSDSQRELADEVADNHHRLYIIFYEKMMRIWNHVDFIFYNTRIGRESRKATKQFRDFVQDAITRNKKERVTLSNSYTEEQKPGIMKQMVEWLETKKMVSEKTLLDDMTTVYVAALDPLSEISCFVLHMLAMHPDIQDKVRQEVAEVVGNGRVEASCLADLKYLEMVIKETVRLFPIGALFARKVTKEVQLDSYCLPEGSMVIVFAYMLHRNPEHWERPEEFIPERFLPENSAKRHPFAFMGFSYGVRSCVGQKFAILTLKTMVANLVRRFRFTSTGRLADLKLRFDVSVRPVNGHRLSISRV